MLDRLIRFSLRNRPLVLGFCLLLLVLGGISIRDLPVEVLPDLTKPTVTILSESPGLAPEEVEANVTIPIERSLMGVPGLTRLRSSSDAGLSLVFAEFAWGADIYRARQLVQDRLQVARETLPEGVSPFLTPVASLMGEILLVGIVSTNPAVPPAEVRSVADWVVRPRLQSIPGIAEVLSMGGGVKQVQIQPDPVRMQAYRVSFSELEQAARHASGNTTGGFLQAGSTEIMVRNLAMTVQLDEIAKTVIKRVNGYPVRISDVASVDWGIEPMRGDASVNGAPGVIMSVTKTPGFDTVRLTREVEAALEGIAASFPPGVGSVVLFRQSEFIEHAIGNLNHAIRDGAIMVTIVIFLFLLNLRTSFITLMAMPLSFATTLLVFQWFGITINSMTLGGLAVAIGMVVDDAIIDVENVYRRLRENAALPKPRPRLEVIARASGEVRNSILYATLLIILVFLPLLSLGGLEGRLFGPIAIATIISMAASFLVSLTAIPVLCSFFLKPREGKEHADGAAVRFLKSAFERTLLRFSLSRPFALFGTAALLFLGTVLLYLGLGKDFLPAFQEETALIAATSAPGTSLEQMNQISARIEQELLKVPEIRMIGRRVGRAERGDHVVPVSTAEFDIEFRERSGDGNERSRTDILAEIRERIGNVPGAFGVLTGPLADRIGHMLSGVPAPIAVKVFGPDLNQLRAIGKQIEQIAKTIPGLEGARLDQAATIPQLRIEVDRARAAIYGVTPGELNDLASALVGGRMVAELREGERLIDLVIRLPLEWRNSIERISSIPIETGSGSDFPGLPLPLSELADVREARGPNVIFRENNQRRVSIGIKPTQRDAVALVEQLREAVSENVQLPEGFFISYEGEFEARNEAARRIALFSIAVLVVIAFLLHGYFRSWFFAMQVLLDIPLALIGGIVFTYILLNNISIASLVGLIAVAGVAARNSIMLISHYLHLMQEEGEQFSKAMVIRGTKERLVPVLMTALSAGIGLIPLVLAANEPGKEILHPVAVVIVGGLLTSTFLGLCVTPTVFYTFGRRAAERALANRISRQAAKLSGEPCPAGTPASAPA